VLSGLDLGYTLAGACVSFLVGLTGVGGGSLMAPVLILFYGVSPAVAIGTDLWFAAITKSVGGVVHHRLGSTDWKIVRRLALGSLPAALITLLWLALFEGGSLESDFLLPLLGGALLVTSVLMLFKHRIHGPLHSMKDRLGPHLRGQQFVCTILGAAVVGSLVTLTSVGAGALIAVLLAMIYPMRLSARSIVGTDIVHAVPLTLVAAIGHSWLGNVDPWLLASLLVGSVPGIILGSLATGKVRDHWVRYALAGMLAFSAIKMIGS
jgi:uncharacterized membrane protein YfcA